MFAGKRRIWIIPGVVLALTVIAGGAGVAIATGAGGNDQPITGVALERASAAALDHTGGGAVTETEVDDEEGYYEVEVTLDDGSQVDVHLDKDFNVIRQEADNDDVEDEVEDGAGPDDE